MATTLYRLAGFGLAYLTPGPLVGGEPLQVLLLERRHGYGRSEAIASVALDRVLELTVTFGALLAAGCYLLAALWAGGGEGGGVALVSGLMTLSALVALPIVYLAVLIRGRRPVHSIATRLRPDAGRLRSVADTLVESETLAAGWLRDHPVRFALAVLFSLLGFLMICVEFYLVVRFLALPVSLSQTLLAFIAARLAQFVLLPGALGALEASQLLSWRAAGVVDALGLAVSLVVRARDLVFALAGLGIGVVLLRSIPSQPADPATQPCGTRDRSDESGR